MIEDPGRAAELRLPEPEPGTDVAAALGASYVTDVLLIRATLAPEGIDTNPFSASKRAAWYSLGFLLREAAARSLDVQSQELRAGPRVARIGADVRTELFLADALENGAGYCTHLGAPNEFAKVLAEARGFMTKLSHLPIASSATAPATRVEAEEAIRDARALVAQEGVRKVCANLAAGRALAR